MSEDIKPDEIEPIAEEAYVWAFPMLMGYRFAYRAYLQPASPGYRGPVNTGPFGKAVTLDHTFRDIVTPNADTPYSFGMLDLRAGPVVLTTPSISDRYWVIQLEDLYGHNDLYVGSRATGSAAQRWFLAGPTHDGDVPDGFPGSHRFETELVFVLGRTQLLGPEDQSRCDAIMAEYRLEPYAADAGGQAPQLPSLQWPTWDEEAARDERFIGYLNVLLALCEPLHPDESTMFERFARIGIAPGAPFDAEALDPGWRESVARGVAAARDAIAANITALGAVVDGWLVMADSPFGTRRRFAGDYLTRASGAMAGWGGNDLVEAAYPQSRLDADGEPYDGGRTYQMRLQSDPPVKAFWSVTMYDTSYDGTAGYLVENPIDRFLISSTSQGLIRDADGSLTITMQREAPDGPFYLTLRMYEPKPSVLDGTWAIPGVRRVR